MDEEYGSGLGPFSYSVIAKFDCHRNKFKKEFDAYPDGFLSQYKNYMESRVESECHSKAIRLFGRSFEFWSALLNEWEWLFTAASMSMMNLRIAETKGVDPFEDDVHVSDIEARTEAAMFRENLTVFFTYIDYYLKLYLLRPDSTNLSVEQIQEIDKNICNLKVLMRNFDRFFYHEQFLIHSSVQDSNLFPNEAYQFIHACFDFRWLFILIRYKLNEIRMTMEYDISANNNHMEADTMLVLMCELMYTSAVKYRWDSVDGYIEEMFICPCVKEFWMLLFEYLGLEAFWDYFNKVLQTVMEVDNPSNKEVWEVLSGISLRPFASTDTKQFTLQFIEHLSKLKKYIKVKTDYPAVGPGVFVPFYSNVREYLNSRPSEKSLRIIIPVIESIMNEWAFERESVMILIWEYMYKRMDASFGEIGTKNRVDGTSCEKFLNEIKSRFQPGTTDDEDSFGLFLRLMASQVKKLRSEGLRVVTLHSRYYLRFNNEFERFLNYNEIGLYRTSSLFLTAALAYEIEKETKKLRELMNARRTEELTQDGKYVKWRTQAAILLLYVENGLDGSGVIDEIKNEILVSLFIRDTSPMPVFLECLQLLIEHRNEYLTAVNTICALFGVWIEKYSEIASSSAKYSLISMIHPLVEDLRGDVGWWGGDEKEKLTTLLCSHILPMLMSDVSYRIARTAACFLSFLIKAKKWKDAHALYNNWSSRDNEDGTVFAQFIAEFLMEETIGKLGFVSCQFDQDIVQCFVKHHLLNEKPSNSYQLAKAVTQLPAIKRYTTTSDEAFLDENKDRLFVFIRLFGKFLYRAAPSERANLELLLFKYFEKFGEWIAKPLTDRKSTFAIYNIYKCAASLACECYPAIYSETKPGLLRSIVDKVFLPMKWYSHYRMMPRTVKEASLKYLPTFIRGLLKIHKKFDYVRQTVEEILEYYFPDESDTGHPFVECLVDVELSKPFSSELANKFLFSSNYDSRSEKCLRLLSSVKNTFVKQVIFGNVIEGILRLIMRQENTNGATKWTMDFIQRNVNVTDLRCPYTAEIDNAVKNIYRTECRRDSHSVVKLLRNLRSLCPRLIGSFIVFLKEEIEECERRRDVDQVLSLRQMERELKSMFI